jgi:hypothetical protein
MSSITLVQMAEKPITVATDEAINSFADNRQGLPDMSLRGPLRAHLKWMRQKYCRRLKCQQHCVNQLTAG